jgi:hypothetical protein
MPGTCRQMPPGPQEGDIVNAVRGHYTREKPLSSA